MSKSNRSTLSGYFLSNLNVHKSWTTWTDSQHSFLLKRESRSDSHIISKETWCWQTHSGYNTHKLDKRCSCVLWSATWNCAFGFHINDACQSVSLVSAARVYTNTGWKMQIMWLTHVSVVLLNAAPGVLFNQRFDQAPRLLPVADVWGNSGQKKSKQNLFITQSNVWLIFLLFIFVEDNLACSVSLWH